MFSFLNRKNKKGPQAESASSTAQAPAKLPDEPKQADWMDYWLTETKAITSNPTEPSGPLYEPLTVGIPAPPPKTVTVPPEDFTPPPRFSGYQVYVPPKDLPKRSRPIRHGYDIPEDFVRVDPYTQPPSPDVFDPDAESISQEAGVIALPPDEL